MRFKGINKEYEGEYITYYRIGYETETGREKYYEMISRNPSLKTTADLQNGKADAVILILHDKSGEKLLLNCEYRMAVAEWVYNFPAGLIDEGESIAEAAKRELKEETGLDLTEITDIWNESYSAVGFSNEKGIVIVGIAAGDIGNSDSDFEEIKAGWFTKSEVRALLSNNKFAARTQAYCSLWCMT